jgi:DNA-binding ferritin-like protein
MKRHRNHRTGRYNQQSQNLSKKRGVAMKNIERFTKMARDAELSQDVIKVERCWQFVEHYQRIVKEINQSQQQAKQDNDKATTEVEEQKKQDDLSLDVPFINDDKGLDPKTNSDEPEA